MDESSEAEKRKAIRLEYGALFLALSKLLFEADPIGINFETNIGEYEPEVGTIIPRLKHAQSEDDARKIIHEEFLDGSMLRLPGLLKRMAISLPKFGRNGSDINNPLASALGRYRPVAIS